MPHAPADNLCDASVRVARLQQRLGAELRRYLQRSWRAWRRDHDDWMQELWLRLLQLDKGGAARDDFAYAVLRNIAHEELRSGRRRSTVLEACKYCIGPRSATERNRQTIDRTRAEVRWVLCQIRSWSVRPPAGIQQDLAARLERFAALVEQSTGWPRTSRVASALGVSQSYASKLSMKLRMALLKAYQTDRQRAESAVHACVAILQPALIIAVSSSSAASDNQVHLCSTWWRTRSRRRPAV